MNPQLGLSLHTPGTGREGKEETHCPRTFLCYAATMSGVSRFLLIGLLSGALCPLSSRAQDIAAPEMPDLDLDTEVGRKLREDRDAICTFLAVVSLEQMVWMMEGENIAPVDEQARIRQSLALIPVKPLARCPEDFRQTILEWKDTCEKALKEAGSIPDELKIQMGKNMTLLMEKYRVQEVMPPVTRWMMEKAGVSSLEGDDDAAKKEMLERLREFKEKLASGEVVIPAETIQPEEK